MSAQMGQPLRLQASRPVAMAIAALGVLLIMLGLLPQNTNLLFVIALPPLLFALEYGSAWVELDQGEIRIRSGWPWVRVYPLSTVKKLGMFRTSAALAPATSDPKKAGHVVLLLADGSSVVVSGARFPDLWRLATELQSRGLAEGAPLTDQRWSVWALMSFKPLDSLFDKLAPSAIFLGACVGLASNVVFGMDVEPTGTGAIDLGLVSAGIVVSWLAAWVVASLLGRRNLLRRYQTWGWTSSISMAGLTLTTLGCFAVEDEPWEFGSYALLGLGLFLVVAGLVMVRSEWRGTA